MLACAAGADGRTSSELAEARIGTRRPRRRVARLERRLLVVRPHGRMPLPPPLAACSCRFRSRLATWPDAGARRRQSPSPADDTRRCTTARRFGLPPVSARWKRQLLETRGARRPCEQGLRRPSEWPAAKKSSRSPGSEAARPSDLRDFADGCRKFPPCLGLRTLTRAGPGRVNSMSSTPDATEILLTDRSVRCDRDLAHRLSWRQVRHRISERSGRERRWKAAGEELLYATAPPNDARRRALAPDNLEKKSCSGNSETGRKRCTVLACARLPQRARLAIGRPARRV